jgi:hypothetical protein
MGKNKKTQNLDKHTSTKTKNLDKQTNISKSDGWIGDNLQISYKETLEIGDFKGGKLYGHIASKYNIDHRWIQALEKGFCKGAVGKNGIKYLDEKLLEIKINDSNRMYTTKVYKNEMGDYLAYFENESNHKGIARILKATKELDIISVDDYHLDSTNDIDLVGSSSSHYHEIEVY